MIVHTDYHSGSSKPPPGLADCIFFRQTIDCIFLQKCICTDRKCICTLKKCIWDCTCDCIWVWHEIVYKNTKTVRMNCTYGPKKGPLIGLPGAHWLREIRGSFWGQLLGGFATGNWHLAVQNTVLAELEIGQISSVCLMSVLFFCQPLFRAGRWTYGSVFRKNRSKNGVPHRMRRPDGPFSGSAPIRLIRGRWHSPQVAPAAPPAPRVHSSTW